VIFVAIPARDFARTSCDQDAPPRPELGRAAGFAETTQVFVDPTEFFRLFRYQA
jgi:hypothetical protein